MPKTDFYNFNSNRAYPLRNLPEYTFNSVPLAEGILLDAGFVVGIDEDYDERHRLMLYALGKRPGFVDIYFRSEGALGSFVFPCNPYSAPETSYNVESTLGVAAGGGAFLVVGDMLSLYAALPAGVSLADNDDYYVEEGLVQYLENAYVRSLNLATEKDDPGQSMCASEPTARWDFAVTGLQLVGTQLFKAGHNAYVLTNSRNNYIEIGAGVGRGEGEPCGRIPIEDYFASSSSSVVAELVQRCIDTLNTINGVPPTSEGNFQIAGSSGIEVIPVPGENKIIIRFSSGEFGQPFCVGGA